MIETIIWILNVPIYFSSIVVVEIIWFSYLFIRRKLTISNIAGNCITCVVYGYLSYVGDLTLWVMLITSIPLAFVGVFADMIVEYIYLWKNKNKYPKCPKCGNLYQIRSYAGNVEIICSNCDIKKDADKEDKTIAANK